ncbi:hypothetical protein [Taklimakanibacter albus]|uniref:Uncharacterized protein n=1 Tax=Taklimakanibacter albus TaxID=2800327 RepID=A0ACC5R357_9HYPH|nr:hypothetical protein [Aestuariivirga sp. YIM B02566]MBK1866798.1 hypothetical protein [Aestuariivirga sp. YIM B02566]
MLRQSGKRQRHIGMLLVAAATGWAIITGVPAESAGLVPPELVGKWGFAVAIGEYCADFNHCAPGSGGSISFDFKPDGRTTFALFQSGLVDGCGQIRSLELKDGRIKVNGGTIVFTPSAGTYKSVNDCRPDLTGTWKFDPSDLKPVSHHWRLEGGSLRITDSSGEASGVYSRR